MDNSITVVGINRIIDDSKIKTMKLGEKTTLVILTMKNGFEIGETSSCVDPENYNHTMGYDICMKKIKDKIWALEGYRLQCEIFSEKSNIDKGVVK